MNNPLPDTTFTFSLPIDGKYLIDLYAGDYVMIGETFADVLLVYDDFVEQICTGYERGDLLSLKSAVHKIMPLFGFVGLLCLETQCRAFESTCLRLDAAALAVEFNLLKDNISGVRSLIETEKSRLEAFNNG